MGCQYSSIAGMCSETFELNKATNSNDSIPKNNESILRFFSSAIFLSNDSREFPDLISMSEERAFYVPRGIKNGKSSRSDKTIFEKRG